MRSSKLARPDVPAALRSSERGGALVMALVAVVTVAALTSAFLQLSTAVTRRQSHMRDKLQAFYTAEAGLAEAWAAIQIKKTGNVASAEDPALYGDGLFWVAASEAGDGFVRLDSTGMVGSGRATLSLVVEEGADSVAALGVYSESPLSLPPGSFVDGYDSRLGYEKDPAVAPLDLDLMLDDFSNQMNGLLGDSGILGASAAVPGDKVKGTASPSGEDPDLSEPLSADLTSIPQVGGFGDADLGLSGRIASGGGITVSGTPELPTTISGDLVPGPQGAIALSGDVTVTGATDPAPAPTMLPDVDVPSLPASSSIQHHGPTPLMVLPGESSLPALDVGENAEVIVEGPATFVVGALRLGPGAKLYVDNTAGPVTIYVTTLAEFAPTAQIRSATEDPADLVLTITANPGAPIALPAGSPIHAVVFAPDAELSIPKGFELFGALVANTVTFAGPPRLHFDAHLVEVAATASKPRLVSWRILELANEIDPSGNPFVLLGLDPAALRAPAEAHDDVPLSIVFTNGLGATVNFNGLESGFDWEQVTAVASLSRNGQVVVGTQTPTAVEAVLDPVLDAIDQVDVSSSDLKNQLLTASPIAKGALTAAIWRTPPMDSSDLKDVLFGNLPLADSALKQSSDASLAGRLASSDLKSVLLAQSPGLSSSVLNDAATALTPSDLSAVLAAQ